MAITDNFKTELLPLVNSFVGAEKLKFSNLLYEKTFIPSEIEPTHTIVTGIRHGNNVPILIDEADYQSFPFVDASSCDTTECGLNHNYSHYKWELGLIECRIPICLRTFDDDFLVFWNSYKMINPTENATRAYLRTALLQFLTNKVRINLRAAKWRVAYFGDKASTSTLFNGFDGIFTQAEAIPANKVAIPKNAVTTSYAAQIMTGQEIYDTLVKMEELYLEKEWAGDKPVAFRMTKKMAMTLAAYLNTLKDHTCCSGVERLNVDEIGTRTFSYERMAFHGMPIIPVREWDDVINKTAELNGGGGNNARVNPNRILLTNKENILIGTQNREELDMFDIWYDRTDRKVYIEAGAYLGAAIPLNQFILAI